MNALHPDLDLTKSHGRRQFGEITAFLTWTDLPQADGTKIKDAPVVVLTPTNLLGVRVIRPCVVPLKNAWAWAEETGDPAHAARQSLVFAEALGLDGTNPRDVMKVTSIVRECLADLMAMPPKPKMDRVVVADMVRTDHETGEKTYSEIAANV
jgi:hypothetical protein